MEMERVRVKCYAKINLFLASPRKINSHHEIQSLIHSISLFDELFISKKKHPNDDDVVFLKGENPTVAVKTPDYDLTKNNLLEKVYRYFRVNFSIPSLTIALKKNIPIGAGLGGGSSDAAGLIVALDELFRLKLSHAEKIKIAQQFGSDVPFFIQGGLAIVEGVGERINPLRFSLTRPLLLVYPDEYISTKVAYEDHLELNYSDDFLALKEKLLLLSEARRQGSRNEREVDELFLNSLFNGFQRKTLAKYPKLSELFNMVLEKTNYILLSGSGSAFFSFFDDIITMDFIYEQLKTKTKFVYKLKFLDRGVFWDALE